MTRLLDLLAPGRGTAPPSSAEARSGGMLDWFGFAGGTGYFPKLGMPGSPVQFTQAGDAIVEPDRNLTGYASQVYAQSGPIAALCFIRQLVFSTVEFKWQRFDDRTLFGDRNLLPLEQPWHGGTTQNLLAKTIIDADVAGNAYWHRDDDGDLVRMRPDHVDVVLAARQNGSFRKVGYQWWPAGRDGKPVHLTADEVVHFMPLQDPLNEWRGMSWMTPVIREVMVDQSASTHQQRFFENAATPNLAVTLDPSITPEKFAEFKRVMADEHDGASNAYKTLYLGGGADVTVVGTDLGKLDLKAVQGGFETRMAAAAGVPPVIVGFREGLSGSSLNTGNYSAARRRFADGTLMPLWQEAAGSFAKVVTRPSAGVRLWIDHRHVPFLREDARDEADIFMVQAGAVRQLLDAGFEPDAAVKAAQAGELSQLVGQHSGKSSVQLLPMDPDADATPDAGTDTPDDSTPTEDDAA